LTAHSVNKIGTDGHLNYHNHQVDTRLDQQSTISLLFDLAIWHPDYVIDPSGEEYELEWKQDVEELSFDLIELLLLDLTCGHGCGLHGLELDHDWHYEAIIFVTNLSLHREEVDTHRKTKEDGCDEREDDPSCIFL
jgi:hypothetical protein